MWRGLNWNKIIFLGIFLAVVSMLAAVNFIFELSLKGYRPVWRNTAVQQPVNSQLEADYPKQINGLFQKYILSNAPITTDHLTQLNEELLTVKVPAKYKRLHWQLVKDLDVLKTGADQTARKAAYAELQSLQDQYLWLSKTLAQFLLAIY
ncbi:MAG: hypothetical protein NTV81_02870 [Candidatus Komeilibacteria bacterium]|nr:hypothetical protein [Candidatus Komeilibacteria bacterium]